jgi:hypothetical protein
VYYNRRNYGSFEVLYVEFSQIILFSAEIWEDMLDRFKARLYFLLWLKPASPSRGAGWFLIKVNSAEK